MSMTPGRVSCHEQSESHPVSALVTVRKVLSRKASYFVIMAMAAMADFINPGFGDLCAGTVCEYGNRGAHGTPRLIHRRKEERLAPDLMPLVMSSQRADW
jgi:hypothetical protein